MHHHDERSEVQLLDGLELRLIQLAAQFRAGKNLLRRQAWLFPAPMVHAALPKRHEWHPASMP